MMDVLIVLIVIMVFDDHDDYNNLYRVLDMCKLVYKEDVRLLLYLDNNQLNVLHHLEMIISFHFLFFGQLNNGDNNYYIFLFFFIFLFAQNFFISLHCLFNLIAQRDRKECARVLILYRSLNFFVHSFCFVSFLNAIPNESVLVNNCSRQFSPTMSV